MNVVTPIEPDAEALAQVHRALARTWIDFESALFCDVFAKLVRAAASAKKGPITINVSEMLPSLDQTWLPDAAGNRFTCEFRMAFLDPKRWAC